MEEKVEVKEKEKVRFELSKIEQIALSKEPANWGKMIDLVKEKFAKGCTPEEIVLLVYLARQYDLDPLKKEIWAVKGYGDSPAQIFTSRDGLLSIAHKTGKFGSMKTSFELEPESKEKKSYGSIIRKPVSATCEIWRKDFGKPFTSTVFFDEYNLGQALWLKKPKTMLGKVAEVQCLRKAFSISGGLYTPDEIPEKNSSIIDAEKVEDNGQTKEQ